ncbi:hypothetical protein [Bradyrhizobium sp.]|uniref:hypothetical protein n=1 Tax=Bradyrhizobium sp. TaxID=376 RepID=UPI00260CE4EF|nr:hypothetical protein [Bradyrhizobium sp.]
MAKTEMAVRAPAPLVGFLDVAAPKSREVINVPGGLRNAFEEATAGRVHNSFLCAGAMGFLINNGGMPTTPVFLSKPSSNVSSA